MIQSAIYAASVPSDPRPELRPYQTRALDLVAAAWQAGKRAPILVLPTGSGKTVIAAELMRRENEAGSRVLFLAPRRELVYQTVDALARFGLTPGVLMAGEQWDAYADAAVGSIDTLVARILRPKPERRSPLMAPGLVIVDECHLSITQIRERLIRLWPEARLLGLTATPSRKDGRALGILWDELIQPVTVAELTEQGYLCPARYFSLSEPDLSRVATVAGDWNQGQLEDAVAPLVGDIVEHWLRLAGGRRTIVFGVSIAHSAALAHAFVRAGVAAEHVDARTPLEERSGIMARYKSGETQVLTNCFLAAYGFDAPETACIVLARPTKSLVLYLQMLGRGLRPAREHPDCLILDHSGAVHWHGLAADPREWTLSGDYSLEVKPPSKPREGSAGKLVDCPECHAVYSGRPDCPECGYVAPRRGREVQTLDGRLVELAPGDGTGFDEIPFYGELCGYALERGYSPGWVAHKFKAKTGRWPPWGWKRKAPIEPLKPSTETRRWLAAERREWLRSRAENDLRG